MTGSEHLYGAGPREDHRGVDLISDALPFGRLRYGEPNAISNAISFAKFNSRDAVIRVYNAAGNVIETDELTIPPPMSDSHRRWISSLN
jgi:hypothetical protein